MTKDEAMKPALEALVDFGWHIESCPQFPTWAKPKKHPPCTCGYDTAITALRQALEQPEQEPVAWIDEFGNVFPLGAQRGPKYLNEPMKPLYTAPPKREWAGLTDEEVFAIWMKSPAETEDRFAFVKAVMKELKEKNA